MSGASSDMSRRLRMPWFALALVALTLAIESGTHIQPDLYGALERHLATTWDALARFEFYRLVTSPLLQTDPGFAPAIIGLTTFAVPVFELRAGTLQTITTFFLGDWLSTVPILLVLKVAAVFGSVVAERVVNTPDSGSSCGALACLGAFALSLPTRLRWPAVGAVAIGLGVRLVFWHQLYDYQHLLATMVGMVAWHLRSRLWTRRRPVASGAGQRI